MRKTYRITFLITLLLLAFAPTATHAQSQSREIVMEESVLETKITWAENRLVVENLPKDGVLEIFSIVGVKVYTQKIKAGTNEYILHLPKGYYIIRIGDIVKKIALK